MRSLNRSRTSHCSRKGRVSWFCAVTKAWLGGNKRDVNMAGEQENGVFKGLLVMPTQPQAAGDDHRCHILIGSRCLTHPVWSLWSLWLSHEPEESTHNRMSRNVWAFCHSITRIWHNNSAGILIYRRWMRVLSLCQWHASHTHSVRPWTEINIDTRLCFFTVGVLQPAVRIRYFIAMVIVHLRQLIR